jgi:DNA adenine methylase
LPLLYRIRQERREKAVPLFDIDHDKLFDLCKAAAGDFMMTYDDAESVRAMAKSRAFTITKVPMKNTHHAEMYELLITPL